MAHSGGLSWEAHEVFQKMKSFNRLPGAGIPMSSCESFLTRRSQTNEQVGEALHMLELAMQCICW
ncbi:MAG TPA: hypothetical protein VGU64_12005, partial [Terriglobales bacterium]|nr:hypothetical protein [Terriglobales bacterium]